MYYTTDPPNKRLVVELTYQKDPSSQPRRREIMNTGYLPRRLIRTRQKVEVPTVLTGKLGTTTFCFTGKKTTESIDVLEDPVRVIELEGTTSAEGVFGNDGRVHRLVQRRCCRRSDQGKAQSGTVRVGLRHSDVSR